jgi:hypothetical protein
LNPRPPPCEGGVHTKLNYRLTYIFVNKGVIKEFLVNVSLVNLANLFFLFQYVEDILWVLSMILEQWFTIARALQIDKRVTLLAIGRIRYKHLAYLRKRKDIEIVKAEIRHIKNRDKGIGIKITARKLHG